MILKHLPELVEDVDKILALGVDDSIAKTSKTIEYSAVGVVLSLSGPASVAAVCCHCLVLLLWLILL